jgi:hypothetical protein
MIDRSKLIGRAVEYVKAHPPNTGRTIRAMTEIATKEYPEGVNLLIQFALQFDGAEVGGDITSWDTPERRLPYGDSRSLDDKSDCSSFWQNIYDIFGFGDIGTYTEALWRKWHTQSVPWEERRPTDLILYKFSDRNPHATHVAGYIGNEQILHTTGPGNPLRVQSDSYGKKNIVCVIRILTDAQYEDLLYQSGNPPVEVPVNPHVPMPLLKKGNVGAAVTKLQKLLNKFGAKLTVDGIFGKKTMTAVVAFQKKVFPKQRKEWDGIVGKKTWSELLV